MKFNELKEAQMHLECINEAWNELNHWEAIDRPGPDKERRALVMEEISCRIWAATYLVQYVWSGTKPENYDATIREARRFNGIDEEPANHEEVH